MSVPSRPVLRYHGGKWRLAPWVLSFFPNHRVYVEPFGGAGSVLLRKPRSYAEVYNDLDGEVVNVFRILRDPVAAGELRRRLELTPFAREEFLAAYQPSDDPVELARHAITRAFMGFGSASFNANHGTGFRTYTGGNRARLPVQDWERWPAQIPAYVERLKGVVIENRDAGLVMAAHDSPETLHYVDPPYPLVARAAGVNGVRQKYRKELTEADHRSLAATIRELSGFIILSGYSCDLYDVDLYPDWERHEFATHADGARDRVEVLWLNPACSEARKHGRQESLGIA